MTLNKFFFSDAFCKPASQFFRVHLTNFPKTLDKFFTVLRRLILSIFYLFIYTLNNVSCPLFI